MYLKCKTNTKLFVELKYLLFTLNVTCMNCSTAGAVTGAITTPLDVIKTRLMIQVWQMEPFHLLVALFCMSMRSRLL